MTDLAPIPQAAEHPVATYLARLAPGSRRSQRTACETLAQLASGGRVGAVDLQWHRLTYAHTQAVRSALAAQYKPATANRHLSALRGVLRECWRLGTMPEPLFRRAVDLEPVRGETLLAGRALDVSELETLLASCDDTLIGRRDAALLACLYAAGLRRAECAALNVEDVGVDGLHILGKGHKQRLVPLGPRYRALLLAWLPSEGPVFRSFDRAGQLTDARLSADGIADILARRAAKCGLAACSPHDLRRSYMTHLLDRGADVLVVGQLAGHANPRTTARYDRRGEQAKQQAVALL